MSKILIFLILIICIQSIAGNYISVKDTSVEQNQLFLLSIELTNTDSIIAFQFDLELPFTISYKDSFRITSRLESHQVLVNRLDSSAIRVLSYSPSNTPISGTKGPVILLSCKAGSQSGTFEVRLKNGILGNANSENVLDSLRSGVVNIITLTKIGDYNRKKKNKMMYIFPNPFNNTVKIKYYLPAVQPVKIYLFNILGEVVFQKRITSVQMGWNEEVLYFQSLASGNYLIGVKIGKNWIKQKITMIK